MTEKLETIEASLSAQEAATKMRDRKVSSLVVVDANNKTVGMVTERDLVRKVCVYDASSKNTSVRDIMSDALVTTDAISEVGVAADLMIQNKLVEPLTFILISIPTMILLGLRNALDVDHITAIDDLVYSNSIWLRV